MSFPKGPRFEPQQVSDVPGPNSYNLCQESQLDAYKRGAFFEKADRFSKDAPSEVPGPSGYGKPDPKPSSKPSANLGDRYTIMQRKVEDLERIHNDGKKTHQAEMERLKFELNRAQKANTENADRFEKQKKQNAILDVRIQDLKKALSTEQGEIKDLRVKLRMSEHERSQLSAKQGEAGEFRKALQSLESKRRDEVRERDRIIADLERSVATEKKRREIVEARLQDLQGRSDTELQAARSKSQSLGMQLAQSQEETRQALQLLAVAEAENSAKQSSLLNQVEQHRIVLLRATEEYGRLAAETVSAAIHAELKQEHRVLQTRTWRLERKLANSDGQITELVNLIRHTTEMNTLLKVEIQDLHEEGDFRSRCLLDRHEEMPRLEPLYDALGAGMRELHENRLSICVSDSLLATSLAEVSHLIYDEMIQAYLTINVEFDQEQLISRNLGVELSDARAGRKIVEEELTKLLQERDALCNQLATVVGTMDELKISMTKAEHQSSDSEHKLAVAIRQNETIASNDKKAIQQLTETVRKSRMAEEGLRAEIEILTTELAEADQFQAAYYSLSDEVKSLIARNEVAEGEAEKLSKFNAEILGHHNPGQRILYVDRIRRELAELKHKLAVVMIEHESITSHNAELTRELDIYKSTSVLSENKPRTAITRISRPPLSVLNQSTPGIITPDSEMSDAGQRFEDFSYAI
ncbi:hypothetical protein DFH06DRAFT_1076820 [Mycena polygramma]|nr:hypothetical protein DFH06DRAFT_1076820 [Mycena polygramma]